MIVNGPPSYVAHGFDCFESTCPRAWNSVVQTRVRTFTVRVNSNESLIRLIFTRCMAITNDANA